jgi:hypothetical protein
MDNQDRRYSIFRLPIQPMPKEFYNQFVNWRDHGGGTSALFHHLLHLDLSGFDPTAPAPLTKSKLEMIDHGMSDVACFIQHFAANLDLELSRFTEFFQLPESPDLITSKMLLQYYDRENSSRVTTNGIARELTKFGFRRTVLIATRVFGSARFNIMRNADRWSTAKPEEVREYTDALYASQLPKKGKF